MPSRHWLHTAAASGTILVLEDSPRPVEGWVMRGERDGNDRKGAKGSGRNQRVGVDDRGRDERDGKDTRGILEVFKKFGRFRNLPEVEKLPVELRRLNEKWQTLPRHVQEGILILARVRPVPSATPLAERRPQAAPGETPEWLLMALTILKDSNGFLSDREISRRVGVSHSTLSRNEAYKNAKRTYLQPFATPGRRGLRADSES